MSGQCTMYLYVLITPDCHPYDFVRPSRPGRIGGNDWALLLIKYDSYALRMLECWLFILIFVLLLPVAFEE